MIAVLASRTFSPAHSGTSSVKRPLSSTGTTRAMSFSSPTFWSSSPNPGAMCTTPVPSETSTQSAASTRKAFGVSAK